MAAYPVASDPLAFEDDASDADYFSRCPACGDVIDYCQGHGEIGDPAGSAILASHDDGDHATCDPLGCDEASLHGAHCYSDEGKLVVLTCGWPAFHHVRYV
jgi:hypothetical protein